MELGSLFLLALAYHCPKEAWDQFMVFDFQKESGNRPNSVNDTKVIHNYWYHLFMVGPYENL